MAVFDLHKAAVVSFNGNAINDGTNYTARLAFSSVLQDVNIVMTERADLPPVIGGKRLRGKTWTLTITRVAGTVQELFKWFDTTAKASTAKLLMTLSKNGGDSSNWYVYATPVKAPELSGDEKKFVVELFVSDPIWRNNTAGSSTWTITATGAGSQKTVTIGGNKFTRPTLAFTPTVARTGGYAYKKYVLLYNTQAAAGPKYYQDITGQTGKAWDTAAIIADNSNKCQINQGAGIDAVVTTIPYDTVTGTIPSAGMGYCGTEQIYWTGKTGTTSGNLTGCARGIGGTTAATHADNAEIKVSKVLVNGDDVRVQDNGVEVSRWITGANSATTGIHLAVDYSSAISLTLKTAIASTGAVATISVKKTTANRDALKRLQGVQNKVIVIVSAGGKELFTFTGVNLNTFQITGCTREQKDATTFAMVAHAVSDPIYWVEHDMWILYGNQYAEAPDLDSALQPMQDTTNSTNASWVWATFYDTEYARPGAWSSSIIGSKNRNSNTPSFVYTGNQTAMANPASEMGLSALAFLDKGSWKGETFNGIWQFVHPFGVTTVTAGGDKYAHIITSFPAVCGLYKSNNGTDFTQVWNEAAPASAQTWTAFAAHSAVSLSGTYKFIRFWFKGALKGNTANNEASAQFDAVTLAINTTNYPVIVVGTEQSDYHFNCRITNVSDVADPFYGEWIGFDYPSGINRTITINCDTKTATLDDGSPVFITKSSNRIEWLDLSPGSAILQFDDLDGLAPGSVTCAIGWNDRSV